MQSQKRSCASIMDQRRKLECNHRNLKNFYYKIGVKDLHCSSRFFTIAVDVITDYVREGLIDDLLYAL